MELHYALMLSLLCVFFVLVNGEGARSKKSVLDFRQMMKVFVRYNIKVNVVPYISIFAFAMGFRGNWEIKPSTLKKLKNRISQEPTTFDSQYNYWDQNNKYESFQNQRSMHSAVQGAFDWHGLNGTACLQRTVCEVSAIHQDDIISKILKIVFGLEEQITCPEEIDCPFSLVDFADYILTDDHSHLSHGI